MEKQQKGKAVSSWLMVQRPSEGLLANQWEFPAIEVHTAMGGNENATTVKTQVKSKSNKKKIKIEMEATDHNCESWKQAGEEMLTMFDHLNFPNTHIETHVGIKTDSSVGKQLKSKLNSHLERLSRPPCATGPISHIFSHQKHQMHMIFSDFNNVSSNSIQEDKLHIKHDEHVTVEGGGQKEARWMNEVEMNEVGITACTKKILERAKSKQYWNTVF